MKAIEMEAWVVAKVREVGKAPSLVAETIAAAKGELEARKPALEAELRRLETEMGRLDTEKQNIVEAVAQGGAGVPALVQRLGEAELTHQALQDKAELARTELLRLENQVIDEADLRKALAEFDGVWTELFPREQARVLRLLVEEAAYDSKTGNVDITFRPGGVRTLAGQARKETS